MVDCNIQFSTVQLSKIIFLSTIKNQGPPDFDSWGTRQRFLWT